MSNTRPSRYTSQVSGTTSSPTDGTMSLAIWRAFTCYYGESNVVAFTAPVLSLTNNGRPPPPVEVCPTQASRFVYSRPADDMGRIYNRLFAFLRSAEFTSPHANRFDPSSTLLRSDVTPQRGDTYRLNIKCSKTDPFRSGSQLLLTPSGHQVCAVKALQEFLRSCSQPPGTPLFVFQDGSYLTPTRLTSTLRSLLRSLGINDAAYASHSFRIGAATTAAAAGLPIWLIKTLGRWTSDAYQRYIHVDKATLQSVPGRLANTQIPHGFPAYDLDLTQDTQLAVVHL